MLVSRWLAPVVPTPDQVRMIFDGEGLEGVEEHFTQGQVFPEHRHPFDEIRMVISGEMFLNVSGNRLLLRAGDKIRIPSNTKHAYETESSECRSLCAYSTF